MVPDDLSHHSDAPVGIVDFHVHFFSNSYVDNIHRYVADEGSARYLGDLLLASTEGLCGRGGLSHHLARADSLGIATSVVFGLADTAWGCADINDQVARAVQGAEGGTAVGFAAAPLAEPTEIAGELRRARDELGFAGVKLYPSMSGLTLHAEPVLEVLELAADLDMIVLTDCSFVCWEAPEFFGSGNRFYHLIAALEQVSRRPRVVAAHLAGGLAFCRDLYRQFYGESAVDEVWFDLSPFFSSAMIRAAVEAVSHERLLFGSDYPLSSGDEGIRALRDAGLPDEVHAAILQKNARCLLDI